MALAIGIRRGGVDGGVGGGGIDSFEHRFELKEACMSPYGKSAVL